MYNKIYCINLDKRKDRLVEFHQDVIKGLCLDETKVKRIPAIDTTKLDIINSGVIGCSVSHLIVWKDMIDNGYSSAIVFEDDFIPLVNAVEFHDKIEDLYKQHANLATRSYPNFSVCCLAWSLDSGSVMMQRSPSFAFANDVATTSGYIITLEYAKLMYDTVQAGAINMLLHLEKIDETYDGQNRAETYHIPNYDTNTIDKAWKNFQNHRWLISHPRIGKQREGYSDIINSEIKNNEY